MDSTHRVFFPVFLLIFASFLAANIDELSSPVVFESKNTFSGLALDSITGFYVSQGVCASDSSIIGVYDSQDLLGSHVSMIGSDELAADCADFSPNLAVTNPSYSCMPDNSNLVMYVSDGKLNEVLFNYPRDVVIDNIPNGPAEIYVADARNHCIRKLTQDGITEDFAGTCGTLGNNPSVHGDVSTRNSASFDNPSSITKLGDYLYLADSGNGCIRRIGLLTDTVEIVAGCNGYGFANGNGDVAQFRTPYGLNNDGVSIYVADTNNHCIRVFTPGTNPSSSISVATLAGNCATTGGYVDGDTGSATFDSPFDIEIDSFNSLVYVADKANNVIREINISGDSVSTLAGNINGDPGYMDGTLTNSEFDNPRGLTYNYYANSLYVADQSNKVIREINISGDSVSTLAGDSSYGGFSDGPALSSRFDGPRGLAFDAYGNIYVADEYNHAIRSIYLNSSLDLNVGTVAGNDTASYLDSNLIFDSHIYAPDSSAGELPPEGYYSKVCYGNLTNLVQCQTGSSGGCSSIGAGWECLLSFEGAGSVSYDAHVADCGVYSNDLCCNYLEGPDLPTSGGGGSCDGVCDPSGSECTGVCSNDCFGNTTVCGGGNCGDGYINNTLGETCDTNNLSGFDCTDFDDFTGGTLSCNLAGTANECTFNTSLCDQDPVCGNNNIEPGETCDGTDWGGITDCTNFDDFTGGTLSCNSAGTANECTFNTSLCEGGNGPGVCGDDVINTGETCDGNPPIPYDWGGITDCTNFDDFTGGSLSCNSAGTANECTFNTSFCDQDSVCGNSIIEPGETCDTNNLNGWDCTDFGFTNPNGLSCYFPGSPNQCNYDISACNNDGGGGGSCGDPNVCESEECGNCNECVNDPVCCGDPNVCDDASECGICSECVNNPMCGAGSGTCGDALAGSSLDFNDTVVDRGELILLTLDLNGNNNCDNISVIVRLTDEDGDLPDYDPSPILVNEDIGTTTWTAENDKTMNSLNWTGVATVAASSSAPTYPELQVNAGDSCSSNCGFCGDGTLDSGEECDDGNNENGDGCDSSCENETIDPGDGDNCNSDCIRYVVYCSGDTSQLIQTCLRGSDGCDHLTPDPANNCTLLYNNNYVCDSNFQGCVDTTTCSVGNSCSGATGPTYSCGDWSDCENGKITRSCSLCLGHDSYDCPTAPIEELECSTEPAVAGSFFDGIGMVIAIIVLVIFYLFRTEVEVTVSKRKKKN